MTPDANELSAQKPRVARPGKDDIDDFVNHAGYKDGMPFVKAFLEKFGPGVVHHLNSKSETAFQRAAEHGHKDMMDFLAAQGAMTELASTGMSHIHYLAGRGNRTAVNWMIAHGTPVDERANALTPLHRAAEVKCPELIADLIALGANVNARGCEGNTPLMISSYMAGAGPNIPVLLENGADINTVSEKGNTALDLAILFRREAELRVLLAAGADMYQKNTAGRCPLDYAREKGFGPLFDEERQKRGEAIASHIAGGLDRALPVRTFRLKSKSTPKFQPAF